MKAHFSRTSTIAKMTSQDLYRIAVFLVLAISAEILMGSAVQGFPRQKNQANRRPPMNGPIRRPTSTNVTKIVGGSLITIAEFPYQVVIAYQGRSICGGTAITLRHVLTAAHCIKDVSVFPAKAEDFHLVFRTTNNNVLDDTSIVRTLEKFVIHPHYNIRTQKGYDVAIMHLSKPLGKNFPLAKLETTDDYRLNDYAGETGIAIGWGNTLNYSIELTNLPHPSQSSPVLKKVELPIISKYECDRIQIELLKQTPEEYLYDTAKICTKSPNVVGVCKGDSGGPLFVTGVQVGIVSGGFGCADPRAPQLFTRVGQVRDWIDCQIKESKIK